MIVFRVMHSNLLGNWYKFLGANDSIFSGKRYTFSFLWQMTQLASGKRYNPFRQMIQIASGKYNYTIKYKGEGTKIPPPRSYTQLFKNWKWHHKGISKLNLSLEENKNKKKYLSFRYVESCKANLHNICILS